MQYQLTTNGISIRCQLVQIDYKLSAISVPTDNQWNTNLLTIYQIGSKSAHWQRFRIIRVPPLNKFWHLSWPIGSQHFKLSTNQKPQFQPNYQCQPYFGLTNPLPMCKLTANHMPIEIKSDVNWDQIIGHWSFNANLLPMECQWTSYFDRLLFWPCILEQPRVEFDTALFILNIPRTTACQSEWEK